MAEIGLEHALDCFRHLFRFHVAIKLASERGVRAKAATDQNVIALDGIAVVANLHLAGEQSDLADEMLCAGVMAAGEMNVYRRIERHACLAPARYLLGVAFGVGGG